MFASRVTKDVELDGGERVVIRKLNHSALERARDARSSAGAKSLRDFGGDILRVLRSEEFTEIQQKRAQDETVESRRLARYAAFDRNVVLQAGIVSWTADVKVTPEAIGDLEEPIAQRLHEEIVDLSLPALDPKQAEEQGKGA